MKLAQGIGNGQKDLEEVQRMDQKYFLLVKWHRNTDQQIQTMNLKVKKKRVNIRWNSQ